MTDIAKSPNIEAAAPAAPAGDVAAAPAASFGDFSSKKMVEGSTEFLESNSWIAKLAFLLMVIIGFVIFCITQFFIRFFITFFSSDFFY